MNDPSPEHRADPPPEQAPTLVDVAGLEIKDLVLLPDPDAEGIEALAGGANRRRRDDAARRLERVLPGLVGSLDRPGAPTGATTVLCRESLDADDVWRVLDTVLIHDDARSGRLILELQAGADASDGELQFATTYEIHRPNVGSLASKLVSGASVTVRSVERHLGVLAGLASDLTTLLGQPCHVDVIAFGPRSSHTDEGGRGGDLLIVPLDAVLEVATCHDEGSETGPQPFGAPVEVAPGRAALIPSTERASVASPELALALRVILPIIDVPGLRSASAAAARYHPLLRADLPTDLDGPVSSYGGSLYDHPGSFHAEASIALGRGSQERAAAWVRAAIPPSPLHGLLAARRAATGPPPLLRAPLPGGVMLTRQGDRIALAAGGVVVTLHPELALRLVPRLDGRPFDPGPILDDVRRHLSSGSATRSTGAVPGDDDGADPVDPTLLALRALLALEVLEPVA